MKQSTKTTSMISILSPKGARRLPWLYHTLPPGVWVRSVMLGVWDPKTFPGRSSRNSIHKFRKTSHFWCNCFVFFLEIPAREAITYPLPYLWTWCSQLLFLAGIWISASPRGFATKLKLISQGRPPWTVGILIVFCNVGGLKLAVNVYLSSSENSEIYIVFVEISPPSH